MSLWDEPERVHMQNMLLVVLVNTHWQMFETWHRVDHVS